VDPLDLPLSASLLRTEFQPILDLRQGRVYGYEALTRGPAGSPFEAPTALFELARSRGRRAELELLAVQCAVERFAALGVPGTLFVNFSPAVLAERREDPQRLLELARRHGLPAKRIVIELSENGAITDASPAWRELLACRAVGFGIAIDDLGEGFASLRLWSELRPEYVKMDKHFVKDVHRDAIKLQMAKAIQQIAHVAGAKVVAEGIEGELDFQTVRDLGILYGQGNLIGAPRAAAASDAAEVWSRLAKGPLSAFPMPGASVNRVTARRLMREVAPVRPSTENDQVYARFDEDPELQAIPVVEDGLPKGMINRTTLVDRFSRPYRRELYGKRSCERFMDRQPLVVDIDTSIQDLSYLVTDGQKRALTDGFIVVENGRYLGVGGARELMREITEMQIAAARYANPLTLLPGNVPIAEHVARLLSQGCAFASCYCDLDGFKPFNDVFGYQRGDEAIQLTARLLAAAAHPELDFVGHVGGDDFVLILQSVDWEARCREILARFERGAAVLFEAEDLARGGYLAEDRLGQSKMFPLLTLSIGAVYVQPGGFSSHSEVAAAATHAKQLAKRQAGNSLFVERRQYPVASLRPSSS